MFLFFRGMSERRVITLGNFFLVPCKESLVQIKMYCKYTANLKLKLVILYSGKWIVQDHSMLYCNRIHMAVCSISTLFVEIKYIAKCLSKIYFLCSTFRKCWIKSMLTCWKINFLMLNMIHVQSWSIAIDLRPLCVNTCTF